VIYWDTSALLKLYLPEADSLHFLELVSGSTQTVVTSSIAIAEIACAFYRKEAQQELKKGAAERALQKFEEDCRKGQIVQIPFDKDVMGEASRVIRMAFRGPKPLMLRALDAIHVASALAVRASGIVATDLRLRQMALTAGLRVLP
jgi:uncharacterized protein